MANGLKGLEKTLSFILFFLFVPTLHINRSQIKKLLNVFAYVCLLALLYCLLMATYNVWSTGSLYIFNPENLVNENFFLYHRFSKPLNLHAVYFGMYLVFSSSIFLNKFKNCEKKGKIYIGILLAFLAVGIYLLQSFSVLVAYFIVLLVFFLFTYKDKLNYIRLGLLALAILLPATLFLNKAKVFKGHVFEYTIEDDIHSTNWNSLNIRLAKWEAALAVVKENNVIFGSGMGCTQNRLNEMYKKKNFTIGYQKKFNTHNEYINYLVELGVLGVLCYLFFLDSGLYISFERNDFLLFTILALIAICGITENILGVNKGIVFFTSLYYLVLLKNEKE
ncbi:O-antigen ligase family protein [Marixanthomonas spongiae]|uniref:O-antigen ligase family protein n=1 Tax=Marixanthomonas spongiae TaxID=2174845 RepID=UPI001403190D|nr:O-antigen ligase family protein [Marixanthomonas spongiae]